MKTGGWYLSILVITFFYFYIYAVNYVRGGSIPAGEITQVKTMRIVVFVLKLNSVFHKIIKRKNGK
jgi:hypothetical protein